MAATGARISLPTPARTGERQVRMHMPSLLRGCGLATPILCALCGPVLLATQGASAAPRGERLLRRHATDPALGALCDSSAECDDGVACTADSCVANVCVNMEMANCVACEAGSCMFPNAVSGYESWGPATAITAERFPWSEDAIRLIVPFGDEGPCNGNFPGGCNEDGDDGESVTNAIAIANRYDVVVSPITGTNSNQCVISLAAELADGTGGMTFRLHDALAELAGALGDVVVGACPSCTLVDLVVVMDTSGSMGDEAVALCSGLTQVIVDLADAGVTVNATLLGIAEAPGGLFSCLSGDVVDWFGGEVTSACDDEDPCTTNDRCVEGVCGGTWLRDCVPCALDGDCSDGDACTQDFCDAGGVCASVPDFDETAYCCDPATQELAPLDDGDPCTDDVCDPATGRVDHPPAPPGTPCDDEQICTADDICDGQGICVGRDFESIACASDTDCFESLCDGQAGHCICADEPTLCLTPDRADCYNEGDIVQVNIELGYGLHMISGGQFSFAYDPSVLRFLSMVPGDSIEVEPPFVQSPFGMEIVRIIDDVQGMIFYAVGVDFRTGDRGTHGPAIMAQVRFRAIAPCTSTDICFFELEDPPRYTLLTNDQGSGVLHVPCFGQGVSVSGGPLVLDTPESTSADADAGTLSTTVTWDPINVAGGCGEQVEFACTATNSLGSPVDHLTAQGGLMPAGSSLFECVATDLTCGRTTASDWSVTVRELNRVEVDVQLAPTMSAGPLERCVEFELFTSCVEESVVVSRVANFGLPLNLPGQTRQVTFMIPAGQYGCMTAWDPMHTFRSVANLEISGSSYLARFENDPSFRGNWLVSGNLDGNRTIDVIDHGIWYCQLGAVLNPAMECESSTRHADINGDGVVDSLDRVFIEQNWLTAEVETCCDDADDPGSTDPVTEISIRDLKRMGLGDLSGADLNSDGLLNLVDVELYWQGYTATRPKAARLR